MVAAEGQSGQTAKQDGCHPRPDPGTTQESPVGACHKDGYQCDNATAIQPCHREHDRAPVVNDPLGIMEWQSHTGDGDTPKQQSEQDLDPQFSSLTHTRQKVVN